VFRFLHGKRHRRREQSEPEELDVCRACGRDMVYPTDWHLVDPEHWWVELRCGGCGVRRRGLFLSSQLDRFECRLEEALREISEEADRLLLDWRSAEADVFAEALDRELIQARDFAG
jgi:hypothetical protein